MRWLRENDFNSLIWPIARREGVDPLLVKAVIGRESGFDPNAFRQEVNDASYGLMQILYGTARGEGYSGTARGLLDPEVNLTYGIRYLAKMVRLSPDTASAVSRYNGGFRPNLGFGAKATKPVRVCLWRNAATGECERWQDVQPGEYGNQPHVDAVMANYDYFIRTAPPTPPAPPPPTSVFPPAVSGPAPFMTIGALATGAAILAALVYALLRGFKG